jgi:hypothetical protein
VGQAAVPRRDHRSHSRWPPVAVSGAAAAAERRGGGRRGAGG